MSQIEELRKEDGKWKTIVDIITNPKVEIKNEQEENVINMREGKRVKWKTWKDNQAVMATGAL